MDQQSPKRIYIAGCVTDGGRISENGYREKFDSAAVKVRLLGYIPVDPTCLPHNHQRRWQDYMIEALHAMLDCDAVLALPCWKKSKGATIEVQLALRLGKEVIYAQATHHSAPLPASTAAASNPPASPHADDAHR